jgi:hypothetical protein
MSEQSTSDKEQKSIVPTIAFYALSALTIFILNRMEPSGPCNPGLGILLLLFLPIISVGLLARNIFNALTKQTPNGRVIVVHLTIMIFFLLFYRLALFENTGLRNCK